MSLIDLTKKAGIILEKRQLPNPPKCRVGLALDVSGSMEDEYMDGSVQKTVDRLLAVAQKFDDNGEMEVWTYHTRVSPAPTANASTFGGYVKKCILDNPDVSKWGGTSYAPPMNAMVDHYFRGTAVKAKGFMNSLFGKTERVAAEDTHIPALMLFVTDGENNDPAEARKILLEAQQFNLYWQLVGVGNGCDFAFIKELADELPNAGFVHLPNLKASDEVVLDKLLTTEFVNWVKKF
jgi:hypothetical protein